MLPPKARGYLPPYIRHTLVSMASLVGRACWDAQRPCPFHRPRTRRTSVEVTWRSCATSCSISKRVRRSASRADEALLGLEQLDEVYELYDGCVVKLDKAGGIASAFGLVSALRGRGLQVLLGRDGRGTVRLAFTRPALESRNS